MMNQQLQILVGKKKKNCKWASKLPSERCNFLTVQKFCPILCNTCFCTDNPKRFQTSTRKKKGKCKWAAKADTENRCYNDSAFLENCPLTCFGCTGDTPLLPTLKVTVKASFAFTGISVTEAILENIKTTFEANSNGAKVTDIQVTQLPTRNLKWIVKRMMQA